MKFYVDASAKPNGDGTEKYPFQTIQQAADLAEAGDDVFVRPGIYRENVDPKNTGREGARIRYQSVKEGEAHISGAERVSDWENTEGHVWKTTIPNSKFGDFNPYRELIEGDWYVALVVNHRGDVFLDEKSLYEVHSLDEVRKPVKSEDSWNPEFSLYTWYTEQDEEKDATVIYANFHGKNPNEENVEITYRPNCFYPQKEGKGYITLSGFKISQAASQWAPPTAYQEGMVGPHWSRGWIIEDCEIYESKCSGISLGKYLQPNNDNKWLKSKYKDGTQTERECILQASYEGWDREHVGSHIVRRCNIHDCGQTGIVGHLGGVFSTIEDNHIHHINNKQNLAGAEIGGIKMHAAIDVVIRHNHIHNCTRGIWLDWQAQGTRVTENILHDNCLPYAEGVQGNVWGAMGEDLFIEVSHGPTLVDNNLMMSDRSVKLAAQGVALVHNLILGSLAAVGIGTDNGAPSLPSPRYTPYHVPHGTKVAGFMTFLHGDCKFFNNIFVQKPIRPVMQKLQDIMGNDGNKWDDGNACVGTYVYDGYPTFEEWDAMFEGYMGMGKDAGDTYYKHLPVWARDNVYLNGARPWEKEENPLVIEKADLKIAFETNNQGMISIHTNLANFIGDKTCRVYDSDSLGMAFEPEERYENPDGSRLILDRDIYGIKRTEETIPGPFAEV